MAKITNLNEHRLITNKETSADPVVGAEILLDYLKKNKPERLVISYVTNKEEHLYVWGFPNDLELIGFLEVVKGDIMKNYES